MGLGLEGWEPIFCEGVCVLGGWGVRGWDEGVFWSGGLVAV